MSDGPPPGESWIPVYDRLFEPDHHLADEPACMRWAWVDLCHLARWRDGSQMANGKPVELKRGQLLASLRYLAKRWKWSKNRVSRFLDTLSHPLIEKLKEVRETHGGTVYEVISYETYALGREGSSGQQTGQGPGQQTGQGNPLSRKAVRGDRGTGSGTGSGTANGTKAGQRVEVVDSVVREEPLSLRSREPSLAAAVGIFLEKADAEWAISTPLDEWVEEIRCEGKYAGADLAYEIRKAADYYSAPDKPVKRPDMTIRNWLERSAKRAQEEAEEQRRNSREEHLHGLGISTGRL